MSVHRHRCMFVPPHVLKNLAKAGVRADAKVDPLTIPLTIQQGKLSRKKRADRVNKMSEFVSLAPVGKADRYVYDCQHQWDSCFEKDKAKLVRKEGGPVSPDESVNNAYDYAGAVREYYESKLERKSIDNANMDIKLYVHFGENYDNAFWDGNEMVFGDGDGELFIDFTKSLDVVAHELAHGVTQWEANLDYQSQSGALNEHFSDVFGSAVTQYIEKQTADTADWLIGDEIMGPALNGEALRSMKEPGSAHDNDLMGKDPQPAHMKDYYTGPEDNFGVHINSGIPNRAFYLTAMDIGTDEAALIWYKALQRLWPTANFNGAVHVIVESARLLIKEGKVHKGSAQRVRAAFEAVGLPYSSEPRLVRI